MGQPLKDILAGLPLDDAIKNTLLDGESPYTNIFKLILAYEKGDWDTVKNIAAEINMNEEPLPGHYKNSIEWVNKISI